jgi:hypothetical protein
MRGCGRVARWREQGAAVGSGKRRRDATATAGETPALQEELPCARWSPCGTYLVTLSYESKAPDSQNVREDKNGMMVKL